MNKTVPTKEKKEKEKIKKKTMKKMCMNTSDVVGRLVIAAYIQRRSVGFEFRELLTGT